MATRKTRVLQALWDAREIGVVAGYRCDDGWVDGPVLCLPGIGGSEGLRRVREIRETGVAVEMRCHPTKGRATRQYRLVPK